MIFFEAAYRFTLFSCCILFSTASFAETSLQSEDDYKFNHDINGTTVLYSERKNPATGEEIYQIKKIIDAIQSGEASEEKWWQNNYKPKSRHHYAYKYPKEYFIKYAEKILKCDAFQYAGVNYGCMRNSGEKTSKNFKNFLALGNIDYTAGINLKSTVFVYQSDAPAVTGEIVVAFNKYLQNNNFIGLKEVDVNLSMRSRYQSEFLGIRPIKDWEKIPLWNLEEYSAANKNYFALIKSRNSDLHYSTPCYMKMVLDGECMPVRGGFGFNVFSWER